MKITNVKATVIEVDNAYRPGQGQKGVSNFIQVFTDEGIEGRVLTDRGPFGEFRARPVSQAIVELYKPMIVGQDPLDRERLWEMMVARSFGGTMMFAVGAIDLCLWDIAGQKAGMPIYKMLGGYRDKIRAYASVFSFESPRAYADYAQKIVAMGYTGVKLHLRGTYKDHIAAARAVREAVGDSVDCFFDANCRYDRRIALIVGRELEKLHYYWYEEPLPNTDIEGLEGALPGSGHPDLRDRRVLPCPADPLHALPGPACDRYHAYRRPARDNAGQESHRHVRCLPRQVRTRGLGAGHRPVRHPASGRLLPQYRLL